MTLQLGHARQVRRLTDLIAERRRRGLYLVITRSDTAFGEVIEAVEAAVPARPVLRVFVPPDVEWPWDHLREAVGAANAPVVVAELGRSPDGGPPSDRLWERLNLGREAGQRLGWDVVLRVPGLDAVDGLRRIAPDLWAYRTAVALLPTAEDFGGLVAPEEDPAGVEAQLRAAAQRDVGSAHDAVDAVHRVYQAVSDGPSRDLDPALLFRVLAHAPTLRGRLPNDLEWMLLLLAESAGGRLGIGALAHRLVVRSAFARHCASLGDIRARWLALADVIRRDPGWLHAGAARLNTCNSVLDVRRPAHADLFLAPLEDALQVDDPGDRLPDTELHRLRISGGARRVRAACAALRWAPLDALDHAHAALEAMHRGRLDRHLSEVTDIACLVYRRLGLPAEALALIASAEGRERRDPVALARLRRELGDDQPLTPALAEARQRAERAEGGPRASAHAWLEVARTHLVLAKEDPSSNAVSAGIEAIGALLALPDNVPLLAPPDALDTLSPDDPDPARAILARLWRRTPEPWSGPFQEDETEPPGPPSWADLVIDPVADLRAEAWRVEAELRALNGEVELARTCLAAARGWYARHGWGPEYAATCAEDAELSLPDLPLAALSAVEAGRSALDGEWFEGTDLRPVPTLVALGLARHRAQLALGRTSAAHEELDSLLALTRASESKDHIVAVLRAVAELPPAAAAVEERTSAARQIREVAVEAGYLEPEALAHLLLARLHLEVGERDAARRALSNARELAGPLRLEALLRSIDAAGSELGAQVPGKPTAP